MTRHLLAEALGTLLLVCTVVGSGIMAAALAGACQLNAGKARRLALTQHGASGLFHVRRGDGRYLSALENGRVVLCDWVSCFELFSVEARADGFALRTDAGGKARLDEFIEIAVENRGGVPLFNARPQVLHHLVGCTSTS